MRPLIPLRRVQATVAGGEPAVIDWEAGGEEEFTATLEVLRYRGYAPEMEVYFDLLASVEGSAFWLVESAIVLGPDPGGVTLSSSVAGAFFRTQVRVEPAGEVDVEITANALLRDEPLPVEAPAASPVRWPARWRAWALVGSEE